MRERQVGEVDVGVVPVGHDGEDGGNHRHDTPMAQLHALQHRTGEEYKPWVTGGGGEGGGGGGRRGRTSELEADAICNGKSSSNHCHNARMTQLHALQQSDTRCVSDGEKVRVTVERRPSLEGLQ